MDIEASVISSRGRFRACENCKRRKKRCDAGKPQCQMCIQSLTPCTYPKFTFKPGPKKGMKHERSWANHDHVQRQEAGGRHGARQTKMGKTYIEEILPLDDAFDSLSPVNGSYQKKLASTANCSNLDSDTSVQNAQDGRPRYVMASHITPPTNATHLPPSHIISHLVEVFFTAVHPQFRLLHRPSFTSQLANGLLLSDKYAPLFLNAMFALSARYSDNPRVELYDLSLLHGFGYTETLNNLDWKGRKRYERGTGFARRASELFQAVMMESEILETKIGKAERLPLSVLQAGTLLSFAELSGGLSSKAYSLISTCVRLAYDYGLNTIDSSEYPSDFEQRFFTSAENTWVRLEELRRTWWCIWDLEIFLCTAKCRPRMIDLTRCQTKLPVDDHHWFSGHDISSSFLPGSLHQLRELLETSPRMSVLAQRIVSCHLISRLVEIEDTKTAEADGESDGVIDNCVSAWERCFPKSLSQAVTQESGAESDRFPMSIFIEQISLLSAKAQMFRNASPITIANYCESFAERRLPAPIPDPTGFLAFVKALNAADIICAIVRDLPTQIIVRSNPFVVCAFWAPACIQLLIKSFAGPNVELVKKASYSLRILTLAMEQLAEYSALAQLMLSSFRRYENDLINSEYMRDNSRDHRLISVLRVISPPSFTDGRFMAAKPTSTNENPGMVGDAGLAGGSQVSTTATTASSWASDLPSSKFISDPIFQCQIDNTGREDDYSCIFHQFQFGGFPEENF